MSDRTGRALGTLDPVIYFRNRNLKTYWPDKITKVDLPKGHYMLPPVEVGRGPELARMLYEKRYKDQGYEWCEAGTLSAVDELQDILTDQEERILRSRGERMEMIRDAARSQTRSDLRQRMISADCSPYERDFITLYLQMDDEKKKKWREHFMVRNHYIWAREMGSQTRVEDRMGS